MKRFSCSAKPTSRPATEVVGLLIDRKPALSLVGNPLNRGTYHGNRLLSENAIGNMLTDQSENAKITGTPYATNPFSSTPQRPVRCGVGNWLDVIDANGHVQESSGPGLFGTILPKNGEIINKIQSPCTKHLL